MATTSYLHNIWENGTDTSASMDLVDTTGTSAAMDTSVVVIRQMETAFYMVAFVLNVFGNTTIIVVIAKYPWLKHNMYVALQTLAVADLLMSVPILLLCVRNYTADLMPPLLYQIINFSQIPSILGAAFHVALVAMERFVAVVFPFQYQAHVTGKTIWICSGLTWIFSFFMSIPGFVLNFRHYMNLTLSSTGFYIANSFTNLLGYFSLAFILFFLNCKVTFAARMQRKKIESISIGNGETSAKRGLNRATKLMVIVVLVFLLLWAPFTASTLATLILQRSNARLDLLQLCGVIIGTYNSSINFLIYAAFNRKLRLAFRKLLKLEKGAVGASTIEETATVQ